MKSLYGQMQEAVSLLFNKLEGWINEFVLMMPNAVIALIIMVLVYFSSRYIKKGTQNVLSRFDVDRTIINLATSISTTVFVLIGLFMALSVLNLNQAVTSLLAGAGLIGLAVGLAFQEPIINTISGILMTFKKTYRAGDLVETNDILGTIQRIDLRNTYIQQLSGELVVIPNKSVIQNPLKNITVSGERRVDINCGISYSDDLEEVKEVAIQAIKDDVIFDQDRDVQFYYEGFGDSSINFTLRFWLSMTRQPDFLQAKSDAIIALKKAFDQEAITIPFPIRTLDIGERESDALVKLASRPLQRKSNGASKRQLVTSDN